MSYSHDHEHEIIPFAFANFRNQQRRFGIKTDDRRRHMYILGKTGMGKTNLMENMIIRDIQAGHGCCYIDPHGDTAEKLLDFIPSSRVNDVVYFNPSDMDYPVGFNVLEYVDESHKHLVGAGLMGVFKKIWPDVWSARMEYIMNNCILALLDYPNSTLMGIQRLLVNKEYRRRVIAKIKDPVVKMFWTEEYAGYEDRFRKEAIAPIQNKVGQFLSTAVIRNIVAQVKSTIAPRKIMDEGKIFIVNLAKGRIGEDAMRLLGGMLVTKMQLAAMERVDMPEADRLDFYLYVDEFQNFATESFANILSEARKYRLNLIVGHQYINQLTTTANTVVRDAIFGNVGTIITFRVGAADAEFLEPEFMPRFTQQDLVNLSKYDIYLRLMIDGVASVPFSATALPPISERTGNADKAIRVSRERYAESRATVEDKIARWSGVMEEEDENLEEGRPAFRESSVREAVAPSPRALSSETAFRRPDRFFEREKIAPPSPPQFRNYAPRIETRETRTPNRPAIKETELVTKEAVDKSVSLSALKTPSGFEKASERGGKRPADMQASQKKVQRGEVVKF